MSDPVEVTRARRFAAQSAIIARGFTSDRRVVTRAVLRTVTNIGIALGAGVAGLVLLDGTDLAFRVALASAGVLFLVGILPVVRLPASVDAAAGGGGERLDPTTRRAHSPWRDPRYLSLAVLNGVFCIQFAVQEVALPLWVSEHTVAPAATMSLLLISNTIIVIALQVPLSRGTHELGRAGKVTAIAGALMVAACAGYALAGPIASVALAIGVLLASAVVHALAEVLQQAGSWGLGFELADPVRAGAYQGVFGMGFAVAGTVAPFIVTATALALGAPGWAILAGLFAASAARMAAIAFTAARDQSKPRRRSRGPGSAARPRNSR